MNPLLADPSLPSAVNPPVIVALDFADTDSTLAFVRRLEPALCRLKIGKELFTASGRHLVEQLVNQGFEVFLDLKYHDIPNTVAQACTVAADMGVWMVDMHAAGGRRMMEAAAEAVANRAQRPWLIGVTVLTSMTEAELAETGHSRPLAATVQHLAELAQSSGLDGVVCSAHEAALLRHKLGPDFVLVTPGIRLNTTANDDDQRRIMTPEQALAVGATHLVMGRPITRAADPVAVLRSIRRPT